MNKGKKVIITYEPIHVIMKKPIEVREAKKPDVDNLTCYKCGDVDRCPYAFDPYNTDGDCLAIK